ncbi:MAG: hypothetical protein R2713_00130 [Ilumatobacteraceae bacterium]
MTDRRPRPVARRTLILAPLPVAAALLVACGSDAPDLPGLSATGERVCAAPVRLCGLPRRVVRVVRTAPLGLRRPVRIDRHPRRRHHRRGR